MNEFSFLDINPPDGCRSPSPSTCWSVYKVFLVSSSSGVSLSEPHWLSLEELQQDSPLLPVTLWKYDSYRRAGTEWRTTAVRSDSSRQLSYAIKTVAQCTQSSPLCRQWVALTLYGIRMDNWLPCTERIYQRKARIFPGIGLWCSSSSSNVICNRINCLNCFQSYNNICIYYIYNVEGENRNKLGACQYCFQTVKT